MGWYNALLGDHQQALTYCQRALSLNEQLENRDGQASTWDSLGYIHHQLSHHTEALECYQRAIAIFRDLGNRYFVAETLARLGDTHHSAGDPRAARDAWQHAMTILDELEHPDADHVRIKLRKLGSPNGRIVGAQ